MGENAPLLSLGERMRFFRQRRGMTQEELGVMAGFSECSACVRIAQYEGGTRKPKAELAGVLARALGVSPDALRVPTVDNAVNLMHLFFALEDTCGLTAASSDALSSLMPDDEKRRGQRDLVLMLDEWQRQAGQLSLGKITREEYDAWRYGLTGADAS